MIDQPETSERGRPLCAFLRTHGEPGQPETRTPDDKGRGSGTAAQSPGTVSARSCRSSNGIASQHRERECVCGIKLVDLDMDMDMDMDKWQVRIKHGTD